MKGNEPMVPLSWKSALLFGGLLLLMAVLFHFPIILDHPIYGTHEWRQADCQAITQNFHHEDRSLFEPRMNYMGHGEEDGFAEFPLVYYLDAHLMQLFGQDVAVSRGSNILMLFAGLFFLFMALRRLLKSELWGAFFPLMLFSSPLLSYYGSTPMLNVPALSMLLIAFYFLYRFFERDAYTYLLATAVFITLAGLFRATMALGAAPLYVIFVFEYVLGWRWGKDGKRIFKRPIAQGLILLAPVLLIGSWVAYAKSTNEAEGHAYFLMETASVFTMNAHDFWMTSTRLYHEFLQEAFTRHFLLFFLLLGIASIIYRRHLSSLSKLVLSSYGTFTLLYFLLWYPKFYQHDYYLFEAYPFALSLPIIALYSFRERRPGSFPEKAFRGMAIVLLFLGVYNGFIIQGKRYGIGGTLMKHQFLLSEKESSHWEYFHHTHRFVHKLSGITPFLRSLGIERDDPVISLPDPTPNHTLSLMDQKGFTQLYDQGKEGKELIGMWMEQGAEYLIINDEQYLEQHDLEPYTDRLLGTHKGVRIYRLPETS